MTESNIRFAPIEFTETPFNIDVDLINHEVVRQQAIGNEVSVVTLKPTDSELATYNFHGILEAMLCESRTQVLCVSEKRLSEPEVRDLYSPMFENRGEETAWIVDFRSELVDYMTSANVRSYLLAGANAHSVAQDIRKLIRDQYLPGDNLKRVRNIVHSPEEDELQKNVALLFGHGDGSA